MKIARTICRMYGGGERQQGMVLVLVMSFVALMTLSIVSLGIMIQRDIRLIERVKEKEQARALAEAGINHALADIKTNGFASRSDFTGTLDTGTYSVVYSTVSGRHLITSTGTVAGVSETALAEVADNTPTAMSYFSGAANDVKINSLVASAAITGDIHANNNVYLRAGPIWGWLSITGDVSATGIVKEGKKHNQGSGDWWDNHVSINGNTDDTAAVTEGADRITFPTFDYSTYKQAAIDSGDYYTGNTTFSNTTLSPGNGIVYVDGDAHFHGTCVINGGVIADAINIHNTLNQYKANNRNVVMSKVGDISVRGRLYTEEALVYAAQDITAVQVFAFLEVNGILLAGRNIDMWNVITYITYNYVPMSPEDMAGESGEELFKIVSWNK